MNDLIKTNGHLTNCFWFSFLTGPILLLSYYYWESITAKIFFYFFLILNWFIVFISVANSDSPVVTMLTAFFACCFVGLIGLAIGAMVGEPKWRNETKEKQ